MVEEDGEEDGITEMLLEQEREQCLLGLLLPTLLLLLSLLKRLQVHSYMNLDEQFFLLSLRCRFHGYNLRDSVNIVSFRMKMSIYHV